MQIIILIIGLAISILTYSGFGDAIKLNEKLLYASLGIAVYFYWINSAKRGFRIGPVGYLISLSCLFLILNVFSDYVHYTQLLNFVTLFGLIVGTNLLSRIKWNRTNSLKTGIILWLLSWFLIQLFLPGKFLSGWNDNSAIGLMPALMCGLCFVYLSDIKFKNYLFYGCLLLSVSVVLTLENRSSIISLLVYGILAYPLVFKYINTKKIFRILYISALLLNVGLPLFSDTIGQLDLYNDLMSASQEYVDKNGGFSDRDVRWEIALSQLSLNPLLGNGGIRTLYYHNFACDVLTQFGWLGFATFTAMYCLIMEKCFSPRSRSNIFLIAFACLLILNTFENAFLANGYFTIFPYFLTAIAWQLKNSKSNCALKSS
ncbi:MAG: O-antigen ligase family protein [Muribaculum sp.]|nr:O-antigen ligase family protein [Muribaculum sp.]